jgi:hypothetical protein
MIGAPPIRPCIWGGLGLANAFVTVNRQALMYGFWEMKTGTRSAARL